MGEASGRSVVLRVPANLLLLGEYAVLEPGGLGFAVAPEIVTTAVFTPRPRVGAVVRGMLGGATARWPGDSGVLGRVADSLAREYGRFNGEIEVDTRALYEPDGRKRGLGSSAAMTVALTALWSVAAGVRRLAEADLVDRAIRIHRAAQGGAGSGYDVATSACGGRVLFTGGESPAARRVDLPWLPPLRLFAGRSAVATRPAVAAYREWKRGSPAEAARFIARSNELVNGFVAAGTWAEAREILQQHRRLGVEIGDAIGVPARIDPPAGVLDERIVWKAVGAGSELGVLMPADPEDPHTIPISQAGVQWE